MSDVPIKPGHCTTPPTTDRTDSLPPFASAIWPGLYEGVAPDPVSMGSALLLADAVVALFCQGQLDITTAPSGVVGMRKVCTPHAPANALRPVAFGSGVTFRCARINDLRLLRRTRSWMRPLIVERVESLVQKGTSQWAYLAEVEGRVVGYVAGMFDPPDPTDYARNWRRAVVTGVAVNPKWRRRGVGRFLVMSFQRAAISRRAIGLTASGGGVIALYTVMPNGVPEAQRFFEALGFRPSPGVEGSSRVALERYRPWWD